MVCQVLDVVYINVFKAHFETKPDTEIWRVVSIGIYFQDMDILMGQC